MPTPLESAIIRIRTADGIVVGAGFLVTGRHILTCAHVVAEALDLPHDTPDPPQADIRLDFPLLAPDQVLTARVIHWQSNADVAGLKLTGQPPGRAKPVRLITADDWWGHSFRAFGFPVGSDDDGRWASGLLRGKLANGWVQIEDVKQTGYFVQPGFSGGPVWDNQLAGVVGMTVAADTPAGIRVAAIIPTNILGEVWPNLPLAPEAEPAFDLALYEQAYLERLKARYAADAPYYVPLAGETTGIEQPPAQAPRSIRRRRQRALADYCEWIQAGQEIKRIKLNTLRQGVDKYPCIILLGDPGSGKTTALENLAYQFATEILQSPHPSSCQTSPRPPGSPAPLLPIPLRLSEFGPEMPVEDFISQGWAGPAEAGHWGAPELAANLAGYLEQGRLFLLFDALNEMPREDYKTRAQQLRRFIDHWQKKGNRFLVTCRVLDYGEELQGLQRVEIQPLDDDQIRTFLQKELPGDWPRLWQALTQGEAQTQNRQSKIENRKLLALARNPYLLTMIIDVFAEDRQLSQNRAELMSRFAQIQMNWAKTKTPPAGWLDVAVQQESLAVLAFEAQHRAGFGTLIKTGQVKAVMPATVQLDPNWPPLPAPPEQVLSLAASANIIEMPVDRSSVRFYHQLLQEYFAARELLKRVEADLSGLWQWPWLESEMPPVGKRGFLDPLPPPPPTGWEEPPILAAGLAPENDDQLVRALIKINPVLAGRCLHEGQAKVDKATRQAVIEALLATIAQTGVALRVRLAAGEGLGYLGDPRLGEFVTIPAGKFVMGGDGEYDGKPKHNLYLLAYRIARYPLTNAEFAPFVEAGGYRDKRWWTEAGWAWKEDLNEPGYWRDSRFNKPNQPVVGISWYESVAYCRWRSTETGQPVRLATEAEWEKAARGTDGRIYPWGNVFDPRRVNMGLGEQAVNTTTPVGIYPAGVSPYGLDDCAGNVWEWCATKVGGDFSNPRFKPYPYKVEDEWSEEHLSGTYVRVLRGGSWLDLSQSFARCAFRDRDLPDDRDVNGGCRLVVSPI